MKKLLIIALFFPLFINAKSVNVDEDTNINATVGEVEVYETSEVEIKWDQMTFTYNVVESYKWDSGTHKYSKVIEKTYWSNNGNKITITNKTTRKLEITPNYFGINNSIKGSFNCQKIAVDGNKTETINFNIEGAIEKKLNNTKIGYITIEIDDV